MYLRGFDTLYPVSGHISKLLNLIVIDEIFFKNFQLGENCARQIVGREYKALFRVFVSSCTLAGEAAPRIMVDWRCIHACSAYSTRRSIQSSECMHETCIFLISRPTT